ncbi:MAG: hypothetical protein M3Y56_02085, partial [Armatimonadota bacterium]|nr:hypothetical protein [Armatimonadota bacterium]
MRRLFNILAACAALTTILAAHPVFAQGIPDCVSLREATPEPRWMSLPMSRLVVNPFSGQDFGQTDGIDTFIGGILPVSLAYYVGTGPVRFPSFWFFQPSGPSSVLAAGLRLNLSDPTQWQSSAVTASFNNETVRVTPTGDFGAIFRTVTVDLDKTPDLFIVTTPESPSFDLKVNSGEQPVDKQLKQNVRLGAITADVTAATGWHGIKTFKVLLYALGKNKPSTFTRVQFFGPSALAAAGSHTPDETVWMPHEITTRATVGSGPGRVYSDLTMPDTDTIMERLQISPGGPSSLALGGQFT